MKYTILALTTALTLLSALPARANRVWVDDPYRREDRAEVIVRRCYGNDWRYNSPYRSDVYRCRYKVIRRRYPSHRYHRVYRPFRDPYRVYYPNRYRYRFRDPYRIYYPNRYRYHPRRGTVHIQFGF